MLELKTVTVPNEVQERRNLRDTGLMLKSKKTYIWVGANERIDRMKALIAEAEAKGRHEDARRARELLETITESVGLVRMSRSPIMPVVIDDLLELGMHRGADLNRVLELLNRRWEESGCRLRRAELINSLYIEDY